MHRMHASIDGNEHIWLTLLIHMPQAVDYFSLELPSALSYLSSYITSTQVLWSYWARAFTRTKFFLSVYSIGEIGCRAMQLSLSAPAAFMDANRNCSLLLTTQCQKWNGTHKNPVVTHTCACLSLAIKFPQMPAIGLARWLVYQILCDLSWCSRININTMYTGSVTFPNANTKPRGKHFWFAQVAWTAVHQLL